jgi:hypothetical protein
MKYRWFQLHPEVTGFPFSPTGRDILINEALRSLPHEFGHSFITAYVHLDGVCDNHLMTTGGGTRDVLRAIDLGCIHRNLAISNLMSVRLTTFVCRKATLQTYRRVDQFIVTVCSLKALKHLAKPRLAWML